MRNAEHTPSIGIIGAGLAGLSAARILRGRGIRAVILDKGRGVGGRTAVRRHGALTFDHGAQYFTARQEVFQAAVRDWVERGVAEMWNGKIVHLTAGRATELEPLARYVGTPAMNAIARHLADGIDVVTKTRVLHVTYRDARWTLSDHTGADHGPFDGLIISTPAQQAAALLDGVSGMARSIANHTLSPCWAVMLNFDARLDVHFDGAVVENSKLSWIARNSSKPGRMPDETWVLHASRAWSTEHIESPPEGIVQALTAEFFHITNTPARTPVHVDVHRWRYAQAEGPPPEDCPTDLEKRLILCGDWCGGGRVEDAYISGAVAADALVMNIRARR